MPISTGGTPFKTALATVKETIKNNKAAFKGSEVSAEELDLIKSGFPPFPFPPSPSLPSCPPSSLISSNYITFILSLRIYS